MNKWIKVEDKLPEIGIEVMLATDQNEISIGKLLFDPPSKKQYAEAYKIENLTRDMVVDLYDSCFSCLIDRYGNVTHWMPLPDAPNAENTEIKNDDKLLIEQFNKFKGDFIDAACKSNLSIVNMQEFRDKLLKEYNSIKPCPQNE